VSVHSTTITLGKAGQNSRPRYQVHCSCGWSSKRLDTLDAAGVTASIHVTHRNLLDAASAEDGES
jgi:hypothetical protein